jgi:signal transduction histidine kinase/CheY-like chemotaxis protein
MSEAPKPRAGAPLPLAAAEPAAETNPFQLTLAGFVFPYWAHAAFALLGAAGPLFLGHPAIAATFLGGAVGVDVLQQFLVRRWLRRSNGVDPDKGLRNLALLCAARVTVYLAPLVVMVLRGGAPEMFIFAVEALALLGLAFSASVAARVVFWGFAGPVLIALLGVGLALGGAGAVAAAVTAMLGLTFLVLMLSQAITTGTRQWLAAYAASVEAIPVLEAARDRAEGAREQARRAEQAKSNFLATMSHEIRTPMNGVLGMAQLLRRDETNPLKRERLDVLLESGEHLLGLLNDVLDLSKIEAGRLEIVRAEEELRPFLERLVSLWQARAEEKGLTLRLELQDGLPQAVMMDALRLRQVLANLISNALKFTEHGEVTVRATARPGSDGSMIVHFAVRDSGVGIPPAQLPTLFERFSQGEESQARRYGGAGLGLAIARQLIVLMGGRIWAESEAGDGATFHVALPLMLAEAKPDAPTVEAAPADPQVRLRVLAVDDNAVNLMVLEQFLTSFGHDITRAGGGPEALELLAGQAFDVVLLDIHMPGMTGPEVLRSLRATAGPNRQTTVVALTADVTSGGLQHYLDLGFDDHVSKPIQVIELAQALARAAARSGARPRRAPAGRAAKARARRPSGR